MQQRLTVQLCFVRTSSVLTDHCTCLCIRRGSDQQALCERAGRLRQARCLQRCAPASPGSCCWGRPQQWWMARGSGGPTAASCLRRKAGYRGMSCV